MTWETVPLGEVIELRYGKALKADERSGSGFPVIGSGGVAGAHHVPLVSEPTIVVGRKGSIGSLTYAGDGCWPIDTAYYVHAKRPLDLRWLYWTMHSLGLGQMNKSAAVPGLNREDAYRAQAPLPPLPEQRRIAAILDEADALRSGARGQSARFDEIEDRAFDHLLGPSVRTSRMTLGDLIDELRYGTSVKSGPHGQPVLRIPNITGRSVDAADLKTVDLPVAEIARLRLTDRDVLFVRSNGNPDVVGRCSAFSSLSVETRGQIDWVYASYLIRARLKPGVSPEAIAALARSQIGRRHMRSGAATSAGQYNINTAVLRSLPAFDPNHSAQGKFARLSSEIDSQRIRARQRDQQLDSLFASLQHRAFRGEL